MIRTNIFIIVITCLAFLCPVSAFAKIPIYVSSQSSDIIGQSILYQLKEKISTSEIFTIANEQKESLISIDILIIGHTELGSDFAIYSAVWSVHHPKDNTFIYHSQSAGLSNFDKTKELASSLFINTESVHESIKVLVNSVYSK